MKDKIELHKVYTTKCGIEIEIVGVIKGTFIGVATDYEDIPSSDDMFMYDEYGVNVEPHNGTTDLKVGMQLGVEWYVDEDDYFNVLRNRDGFMLELSGPGRDPTEDEMLELLECINDGKFI